MKDRSRSCRKVLATISAGITSSSEAVRFISQTSVATALVALTLSFQCGGMAVLIHRVRVDIEKSIRFDAFRAALFMVRFITMIIGLHLLQVLLWAGFFRWRCFPSWEAAFYFSTASYSTLGCGDLFLPRAWRFLGPVESLTGVLMCGLSAALLFAIVIRLVEHQPRFVRPIADRPFNPDVRRRTG